MAPSLLTVSLNAELPITDIQLIFCFLRHAPEHHTSETRQCAYFRVSSLLHNPAKTACLAKLAEQHFEGKFKTLALFHWLMTAYLEMFGGVERVASPGQGPTVEERNLLPVAYKNIICARCAPWKSSHRLSRRGAEGRRVMRLKSR